MANDGGQLFDAHLHLQEDVFAPHLHAVMGRAAAVGVRYFVCNGALESSMVKLSEAEKKLKEE